MFIYLSICFLDYLYIEKRGLFCQKKSRKALSVLARQWITNQNYVDYRSFWDIMSLTLSVKWERYYMSFSSS